AVSGGHVGAVVQAGAVHGDLHVHSSFAPEIPRQIPLAPRNFIDRETETDRLGAAATAARDDGAPRVVVLSGPGGVGKTALATSFLHAAADSFPDGLLYADLRGFAGDGPVDPAGVLDGFLRTLHTSPARIALDPAGRAAQFRSRTAGCRMAFLLDNAASAAQVRMLLPGAGDHLVLVTTRLRLAGLAADG
ncbi:AAA family ATPase, partial [Streptomonospora algeriensis]